MSSRVASSTSTTGDSASLSTSLPSVLIKPGPASSVAPVASPASGKVRISVAPVPVIVSVVVPVGSIEASPPSPSAHKCHAHHSRVRLGSDFLHLQLDTVDVGRPGLQQLLGTIFLLESNKTEIFPFVFSFVKWLLDRGDLTKLSKVVLDVVIGELGLQFPNVDFTLFSFGF